MVFSKLFCNKKILYGTIFINSRSFVSAKQISRLCLRNSVRSFARLSRSSNKVTNSKKAHESKPKLSSSWRKITLQTLFTVIFLYIVYQVSIINEVIETRFIDFPDHKFDVYDSFWADILSRLGLKDTLLNRRIMQLSGLMVVCFSLSSVVRTVFQSQKLFYMFGSGSNSLFVSPITSMFLHGSLLHLISNIVGFYVLTIGWYQNGPPVYGSLDKMSHQHLLFFLLLCGSFSSLICNVRYAILKSPAISVGFSAALYGLMMFELSVKSESRIGIIFLPQNVTYSAKEVSIFIIAMEFFLLAVSKYHRIDNFGHMAGLGFGYLYSKIGNINWEYHKEEIGKHI